MRLLGVLEWTWLFDTRDFAPRATCGQWTAFTETAYIGGQLLIVAAYLAIPLGLIYLSLHGRDSPRISRLTALFSAFILMCGLGHLFDGVLAFWWPAYRFFAVWHLATGIVSGVTSIVLLKRLPELLTRPDPELYQHVLATVEELRADYDKLARRYVQDNEAVADIGQKFDHLAETVRTLQHERNSGRTP